MAYTGTNREDTLINRLNITNLNLKDNSLPISFNVDLNNSVTNIIEYLLSKITQLEERVAEESLYVPKTGVIEAFAGNAIDKETGNILSPPNGYEWCFGQIVSKTDEKYSSLYAVIGDYWNTSNTLTEDQFQLPDLRNVFLRGCPEYVPDDSSNRDVGNYQSCGAPEIWAECEPNKESADLIEGYLRGALAYKEYAQKGSMGNDWAVNMVDGFDFKASRCSSVYQEGLTEVRPDNKAVNYIIKL